MTLNSTLFWAAALALTAGALAFRLPGLMRGDVARRRAAFWVVAAVVPLAAAMLYIAFGTPQAIDATSELGPDLAPTSTSDYLSRLESQLKRQPRDARGWVLLARAHPVFELVPRAKEIYETIRNAQRTAT